MFQPKFVSLTSISKPYCLFFEVNAHAIYVRNLPLNATETQLEDEFKKLGTIKQNGIQVRSNKVLFSSFTGFGIFYCYPDLRS
jgi:hypothetical protein